MRQYKELANTYKKYINGELSVNEARDFLEYIHSGRNREDFERLMQETLEDTVELDQLNELIQDNSLLDRSWTSLQMRISLEKTPKTINWRYVIGVAATILCVLSVGLWFYIDRLSSEDDKEMVQKIIEPGHQTATLTLADGRKIRLEESGEGELTQEGGVIITKSADGQLLYHLKEDVKNYNGYNTLSTSRGETYSVKLPDGTQVWLNATSSITYAANFSSHSTRMVKLRGEAYFEVAKDKNKPFVVQADDCSIQVLGTSFSIRSYENENNILTTLVEGKVHVFAKEKSLILKPGEQLTYSRRTGEMGAEKVDANMFISWTSGKLMFRNERLEDVLQTLSKWYEFEYEFEDEAVKSILIGASFDRYENMNVIIDMLKSTTLVDVKQIDKKIYLSSVN